MTESHPKISPQPKRRGRVRRAILWLVLILVLLAAIGEVVVSRLIRAKLMTTVGERLDARLEIDSLLYIPPFRVCVGGVRLIGKESVGSEEIEAVAARGIDLQLAEFPKRGQPLRIASLAITQPSVRFVREPDRHVVTPVAVVKPKAQPTPETPRKKLSDILRLTQLSIEDGRVVLEDRAASPGQQPEVWSGIRIDVKTAAQSVSTYDFNLAAKNAPIVELRSSGSIDVDEWHLVAKTLGLRADIHDGSALTPLPAGIKQILDRYGIAGKIAFDADGDVPLRDLASGDYRATLELSDARGRSPRLGIALDRLAFKLACAGKGGETTVNLASFEAVGGDAMMRVNQGTLRLHHAKNTWEVAQLEGVIQATAAPTTATKPSTTQSAATQFVIDKFRLGGRIDLCAIASGSLRSGPNAAPTQYEIIAYPRDVRFHAKNYPEPFEQINGGPIRVVDGIVKAENLSARYGGDTLSVMTARLPLADLPDEIRFREILGTVTFTQPGPKYYRNLQNIFDVLRPAGVYTIGGNVTVDRAAGATTKPAVRYNLMISADDATMTVSDWNIPIPHIRGDAALSPSELVVNNFESAPLIGRATAKGKLTLGRPFTYDADVHVSEIDLKALSDAFAMPKMEHAELSGLGSVVAHVSGAGNNPELHRSAEDTLRASGEFEVIRGQLWELPVLKAVAKKSQVAREALTATEAAGAFEITDRTITLRHVAVSAPVLGLHGSGTITFDGDLNLDITAALLADWRDKMKQTGIPLVSDVAGDVLGGVQRMLNAATSNLLYQFKVTGREPEPKVQAVPVPMLTEGTATLFADLVNDTEHHHPLIEWTRKQLKKSTTTTTSPTTK